MVKELGTKEERGLALTGIMSQFGIVHSISIALMAKRDGKIEHTAEFRTGLRVTVC